MKQAIWNDVVIAESDETVFVEGNDYFPPDSIKKEFFQAASKTTSCPWKGVASYYDIVVDGQKNTDAAWYYAEPSDRAKNIKGHVAFWKGVTIR